MRADRVARAERRADVGSKRDHDLRFAHQRFHHRLDADVAAYYAEIPVGADVGEAILRVHEVIDYGNFMSRREQFRNERGAKIAGAAGDEYSMTHGFPYVMILAAARQSSGRPMSMNGASKIQP